MKCTCGNPMREHIIALNDIWWICMICGRQRPAEQPLADLRPDPAPKPVYAALCRICGRTVNVGWQPTTGTINSCGRCNVRRRTGRDLITVKPVATDETSEVSKTSEVCIKPTQPEPAQSPVSPRPTYPPPSAAKSAPAAKAGARWGNLRRAARNLSADPAPGT